MRTKRRNLRRKKNPKRKSLRRKSHHQRKGMAARERNELLHRKSKCLTELQSAHSGLSLWVFVPRAAAQRCWNTFPTTPCSRVTDLPHSRI